MQIRIGIHKLYFKIAQEQQWLYRKLDSEYLDLETRGIADEDLSQISDRMFDLYTDREQAAVISVTFSAMCLEAFLYDYAAEKLDDAYVRDHLDKLDLPSKLVLYPKLVVAKDFDKSTEAYAKTVELVRLRNELVHFKSKPYDLSDDKAIDMHANLQPKLAKGVDDSTQTVRLVLGELDRMNGSNYFSIDLDW